MTIDKRKLYSNIFLRGTIPVILNQLDFYERIAINQDERLQLQAFQKHFTMLHNKFKHIMCINLCSKASSVEVSLSQYYEKLCRLANFDYLRYEFYDLIGQITKRGIDSVDDYIRKFNSALFSFKQYHRLYKDPDILQTQQGRKR